MGSCPPCVPMPLAQPPRFSFAFGELPVRKARRLEIVGGVFRRAFCLGRRRPVEGLPKDITGPGRVITLSVPGELRTSSKRSGNRLKTSASGETRERPFSIIEPSDASKNDTL